MLPSLYIYVCMSAYLYICTSACICICICVFLYVWICASWVIFGRSRIEFRRGDLFSWRKSAVIRLAWSSSSSSIRLQGLLWFLPSFPWSSTTSYSLKLAVNHFSMNYICSHALCVVCPPRVLARERDEEVYEPM
jgi:hypothetical protein